MRFLMICMQFPVGEGRSYMTTELADALVAAGHEVEVLLVDWHAPAGTPTEGFRARGVRVVRCTPRMLAWLPGAARDASKFILTARNAGRAAERLDLASFDAAIAWAPALAIAPVARRLEAAGVPSRLLFIWDVFPDHHREIGRIPGGPPYRIARALEQRLMARFTALICTLPANARYMRRRFRVRDDQQVLTAPIWCETAPAPRRPPAAVRRRHGLPERRPIAVFGGQLVEGRGFEQMLAAAQAGEATGSPLLYLFVGDGRLSGRIDAAARSCGNVRRLSAMPRHAYLELLGACDVGLVATVPGVSSYSFPSKTADYLRAGLPVIAAVEPGNDFVEILERYRVGLGAALGDAAGLQAQAERLALDRGLRRTARRGAKQCLDEVFDVRHAVATVLEAAGA